MPSQLYGGSIQKNKWPSQVLWVPSQELLRPSKKQIQFS